MRLGRAASGASRRLKSTAAASAPALATNVAGYGVNGPHQPSILDSPMTKFDPIDNAAPASKGGVNPAHWEEGSWGAKDLRAYSNTHCMNSWTPGNAIAGVPFMVKGEGVTLTDMEGKEYIDLTSQAVCANLGYTVPENVQKAVAKQLEELPFVYGGLANCEPRPRLASLLSEIMPGDLNGFMFPCGGGEANEAAIRLARRYTGRQKIITHYRSYHGGTTGSLAATGDFRRWWGEAGAAGFVKAFGPSPWHFSQGQTEEEAADRALAMLQEQILLEGPQTIAAIMMESIVGAGGAHKHPAHYVQGVRSLCDEHGIVFIADEVMVGFGRTGTMWGFQHYDGVLPDIVTSAKGLTAAYLPLAMVGVRQHIKEFFDTTPSGWGATYHAHPVAMACAYECIKHSLEIDLLGKVAQRAPVLEEEIGKLVVNHPSVKIGRAFGMFGAVDFWGPDGKDVQLLQGPPARSEAHDW
jgi:taurine--2-oxoglutarate transaminase